MKNFVYSKTGFFIITNILMLFGFVLITLDKETAWFRIVDYQEIMFNQYLILAFSLLLILLGIVSNIIILVSYANQVFSKQQTKK